jgi:hypothetical protein
VVLEVWAEALQERQQLIWANLGEPAFWAFRAFWDAKRLQAGAASYNNYIFEYKSPGDYASVGDFQKSCAYVWLYAVESRADILDITLRTRVYQTYKKTTAQFKNKTAFALWFWKK